jgi:hypothetical protein
MKGRYRWNRRDEESLKKAIEYFNQAIAKDPTYALAYGRSNRKFRVRLGRGEQVPTTSPFCWPMQMGRSRRRWISALASRRRALRVTS